MKRNTISIAAFILSFFMGSCSPDASKKAKPSKSSLQKAEILCWKDIKAGELPPEGAYYAIDSLVKKWGLCYERIETGCEVNDSIRTIQKEADRSNDKYFKSLEKKLGKNWKQQFDQELQVLDSINWIKISEQITSANK
ncbi:hypothetical protein JET18_09150 [Chryseobacterium sp. L7]|uniref:Lipoprotein n=1 Tax=Chryseobacterium endalhagicum TaxID=2797638 RepID=A0ABS1QEH0_9FLAO|nr:hypothetical protein [Chryseobacterium endalhagicum]MBL1221003.1 hypothetical protein [Chryseobacterium endalhagicum]